ncbi:MAG: nuclear transport factor 2 family protein [Chloroflexi bacterium]|nr:nuclear transport factor 2 family protein [Chloroflexota bacterium]
MTTTAETPADILEHQTAAWNAADVDAILQDFAPDAVLTNASGQTLSGIPAIRQSLTAFFSAFAQVRLTVRALVAQGDTAACEWEFSCRHRLTGNAARLPASVFITCVNGKITDWREYYDTAQFKAQLGQG